MFKEHATIDYACKIAGILSKRSDPAPAGEIASDISAPQSYVCKVLSRMTRAGLLRSGVDGYELAKPLDQLTFRDVLEVCHPGITGGPAARGTEALRDLSHNIPLSDLL